MFYDTPKISMQAVQTRKTDSITGSGIVASLLDSDGGYFEAAAEAVVVRGARLVRLRGLESLAAGCVAHRIDPRTVPADRDSWITDIERRFMSWGAGGSRFYLQASFPALEDTLAAHSYLPRGEIGVVLDASPKPALPSHLTMMAVRSEAHWKQKLELHRSMYEGPDGHEAPYEQWVEMERRRSEAGYMVPYLICADGKPVGAVGAATWDRLLRIKNLVVAPDFRLRDFATLTVRHFAFLANTWNLAGTGAFVLENRPAMRVYERAGFRQVTVQTEWSRTLV